ncbi:MAG: glycosyl hydrolase [Gracilimonas sp.]|nr:glycosyl hydrolase [Gracilimonas sp.]
MFKTFSFCIHHTLCTFTFILFLFFISDPHLKAQSVSVGNGSYSTQLPAGALGPQNAQNVPISPLITNDFTKPVQTNDYWSSLLYPFFGDSYSSVIFAHPLNMKAVNTGLQIGTTTNAIYPGSDYLYPYSPQLTVGVSGLNANQTLAKDYGDWTFTANWFTNDRSMEATAGHGLPYVFFRINGGNARVTANGSPTIWHDQNEVLGITIDGKHYGLFAPEGSDWTGSSTFETNLNGKDYFSIALLPDNDLATLEKFRKSAYAFVIGSSVEWSYDKTNAELISTYTYETELLEDVNENVDHTLTALYPHQWKYVEQLLTAKEYASPRGTMKLFSGNQFSTKLMFSGITPSLPDEGNYDRQQLTQLIQQNATESIGVSDTYNNGKQMGRFAELVHIADQLGLTTERDHFLSELKNRLEDWLTTGGAQEYSYNDEWDIMTGYPSSFGADTQINDHHFHSSYAIRSAAVVAQYDPQWAAPENWGGMVNMLIRDANNWDRTDSMFPFLRSFDIYAGHSWASGHGAFGDGNNQESSSEAMNFASSVMLWGSVTGQDDIRDLGIFLHSTERTAIEQYWFDIDDQVFPASYPYTALGIVWGGKGAHTTWFGSQPEFIHGINILPINSGSLYLGRHPDFILENYQEIVNERGGQPAIWKDVLWQYLAMADPDQALGYYLSDPNYQRFDGESKAHTMHWLYNIKKLGKRDTVTYANIPTYSVFANDAGEKTYVAYNPGPAEIQVQFSDGFNMAVPSREMKTESMISTSNDESGIADLPSETSLKANYPNPFNPATNISFTLSRSESVTLEVFNIAGQKVATLLQDQTLSAGTYSQAFEANNLSSGLYVYQLKTSSGFFEARKMMLVK